MLKIPMLLNMRLRYREEVNQLEKRTRSRLALEHAGRLHASQVAWGQHTTKQAHSAAFLILCELTKAVCRHNDLSETLQTFCT
jgi:hypothetical protein